MDHHRRGRIVALATCAALAFVASATRAQQSTDNNESKATPPERNADEKKTESHEHIAPTDAEIEAIANGARTARRTISELDKKLSADRPLTPAEVIEALGGKRRATPEKIFDWVREHIRYEPYEGAMRGPRGTLVSGSANAPDQAMLVAALLEAAGHDNYRFVEGKASAVDAKKLLEAFSGRARLVVLANTGSSKLAVEDSDISTRTELVRMARDHAWIEVRYKKSWKTLDPVMSSRYGRAVVKKVARRGDALSEGLRGEMSIELVATLSDGQKQSVLTWSAPFEKIAHRTVMIDFLDDVVHTDAIRPVLFDGHARKTGARFPRQGLERLALEVDVRQGSRHHRSRRDLVRAGAPIDLLDYDRAHIGLTFLPGWSSEAHLEQRMLARARDALTKLDTWRQGFRSEDESSRSKNDVRAREVIEKRDFQKLVASVVDQIAPIYPAVFARTLDRLLFETAYAMGVRPLMLEPRVLATAYLRSGTSFDMDASMLDGGAIDAVAMDGIPAATVGAFRTLAGPLTEQLGGDTLEMVTRRLPPTVAVLMERARRKGVSRTTLAPDRASRIDSFGGRGAAPIRREMARQVRGLGRLLLVPVRAIELDGISLFGWWSVDPADDRISSRFGDGLLFHQHPPSKNSTNESKRAASVHQGQILLSLLSLLDGQLAAAARVATTRRIHRTSICRALAGTRRITARLCRSAEKSSLPSLRSCLSAKEKTDTAKSSAQAAVGDPLGLGAVGCRESARGVRCGTTVADAFLERRLVVKHRRDADSFDPGATRKKKTDDTKVKSAEKQKFSVTTTLSCR